MLFSKSPLVEVININAIYDYKEFYDKFIDKKYKSYEEEQTQHGFCIQQLSPEEKEAYPDLIVKTNYKNVS
jgi:hypothetical protein